MLLLVLSVVILVLAAFPLFRLLTTGNRIESGNRKQVREVKRAIAIACGGILLVVILNQAVWFFSELLWFDHLGFSRRFWTVLIAMVLFFLAGTGVAATFLYSNYRHILKKSQFNDSGFGWYIILVISLLFGLIGSGHWNEILLFLYQVHSTDTEPIFLHSVSFYLFSLPFYSALLGWSIALVITGSVLVLFLTAFVKSLLTLKGIYTRDGSLPGQILFLAGLLLLLSGAHFYLELFNLLYSNSTAVTGVGYTDNTILVYSYYILAVLFVLLAILLLIGALSEPFRERFLFLRRSGFDRRILIYPVTVLVIMALSLWIIPYLVQALVVSPNEITLEKPYLMNNIEFTRKGYAISREYVSEELFPTGSVITSAVAENNQPTLDNIRLWDWHALLENLRQQQEIRLYYKFNDADIDRYVLDGKYRQVMLAVRELEQNDLDPRSRNWISLHLKYTHGFGAVLLPAHDVLPQGKPDMLIKNIPPVSSVEHLSITQPRIYFGELTDNFVYVNTTEMEFDYPSGDSIAYNTYSGDGGVPIGSFFRRLLYALKFDDYRLIASRYFTDKSKIMFRRNILERAETLIPFLVFDHDPYPVIRSNGSIAWILDAYTLSSMYPYSQRYKGSIRRFAGNNYIRNSVKVVIDAFTGSVEPWLIDSSDVIIRTYEKIFPGMFRKIDEMPEDIKAHIRYPVDYFTIQAEMYSAYHMVNPEAFYQREDLWEFATERYREDFQRIAPYYVMQKFPGEDNVEFSLIVPFTPKNKNVMNGWMAGHSDIPDYGKLTVFPVPKGVEILGPRQIEARIDQNTTMSQSITLWGQRGSEVLRGNLLVIPLILNDTLFFFYVEPLLIQAKGAQLPEIKRIIVADQERVLWAENFEDAFALLVSQKVPDREDFEPSESGKPQFDTEKIRVLLREFKNLLNQGDYSEAGERLEKLLESSGEK